MTHLTRGMFLFVIFYLGGSSVLTQDASSKQPPASAVTENHRKMEAWLAKIRDENLKTHPVLGNKLLYDFREQLKNLGDNPHPQKLFNVHSRLGEHEMRMNNLEQGIKHLEFCVQIVETINSKIKVNPGILGDAYYNLGIGYMRMGETENCCVRNKAESCILPIRGGGVHILKDGSTKAAECFLKALTDFEPGSPKYLKAQWLLNLVHQTLGTYPEGVPTKYRIDPIVFTSRVKIPRFINMATPLGLDVFDLAGGVIIDDFNNDERLDVLVSTLDPKEHPHLFINKGNGHFEETTHYANLTGLLGGLNMVQADYDNDGDIDFYVMRGGWFGKNGRIPNSLVRNNGDGSFTDVSIEAGLAKENLPSQTAAWADYDLDGDLDLLVGNENSPAIVAPAQLFRNNGDGTFTDVTMDAGITNYRFTKGVAWGDINNDGYPDAYFSNIHAPNKLLQNQGDGTFRDITDKSGTGGPFKSFPVWFWDYNNDGNMDLYASSYDWNNGNLHATVAGYLGLEVEDEKAKLYQGDGKGGFEEVGKKVGFTRMDLPMGANYGDLNNDGFPDFYLGTGYPDYEALMPNVMYLNMGGQRFEDVTFSGGFGHLQKGHGAAFADIDNDGDEDVFEQIGGFLPGDKYGNALFINPGFGNNSVTIRLVGVQTNRSAIGARIKATVTEDGKQRHIFTHISSGGNFGANPLRATLGIGKAKRIDRLAIYWPVSKQTQVFENIPAGLFLRITEGKSKYEDLKLRPIPLPAPDLTQGGIWPCRWKVQ